MSEDINTDRPSTDSVYELPPGKGNFNDPATWGGNSIPNRNTHDIVYIPAGFNLALDTSTYIRVWIVEGRLDFATNKDIHMEENSLSLMETMHILQSERLMPRTLGKLLHNNARTLAVTWTAKIWVKVIAMTSGRLTFYGQPVEPWSLLHATAECRGQHYLCPRRFEK